MDEQPGWTSKTQKTNRVEQHERLLHLVLRKHESENEFLGFNRERRGETTDRVLVLDQALVVARDGDKKEDGSHVLEAAQVTRPHESVCSPRVQDALSIRNSLNPLLPFRTLPSNVEHRVVLSGDTGSAAFFNSSGRYGERRTRSPILNIVSEIPVVFARLRTTS